MHRSSTGILFLYTLLCNNVNLTHPEVPENMRRIDFLCYQGMLQGIISKSLTLLCKVLVVKLADTARWDL